MRSGLAVETAANLILIAILAGQLLKMLAALAIVTRRFALRLAIVTAIAIAGGAATRLALGALG
ncbi:MAG: hypothetical protein ABL956_02330 [Hyphomonadaceae bacterium]